jgi:hypothetical protein
MKLMARSPQPFSSSTPPPARSVDTARQGLGSLRKPVEIHLFYPLHVHVPFPRSTGFNHLTNQPFTYSHPEFEQLFQEIERQNSGSPRFDMYNFLHMFTQAFQTLLTYDISQKQSSRILGNLQTWSNPEHLALDLVTQTTDPTREVQLLVAPRSKKLCQDIFDGRPPELDMTVKLGLEDKPRPTKHLQIEAKPGNIFPVSKAILYDVLQTLSLPDVAVHLNRR